MTTSRMTEGTSLISAGIEAEVRVLLSYLLLELVDAPQEPHLFFFVFTAHLHPACLLMPCVSSVCLACCIDMQTDRCMDGDTGRQTEVGCHRLQFLTSLCFADSWCPCALSHSALSPPLPMPLPCGLAPPTTPRPPSTPCLRPPSIALLVPFTPRLSPLLTLSPALSHPCLAQLPSPNPQLSPPPQPSLSLPRCLPNQESEVCMAFRLKLTNR